MTNLYSYRFICKFICEFDLNCDLCCLVVLVLHQKWKWSLGIRWPLQRVSYDWLFLFECKDLILCHTSKIHLGYISFIILWRPDKSTFSWRYIVLRMREKSKFLQPLIYFKDCLLVMSFLCVYSTSRIICGQWKFNTDLWSWNFFSSDARIIYRALHHRGCTLCY